LSLAERWLLRRCGRVIAVGQAERDAYVRLGARTDRVRVVPPAAPVSPEQVAPAELPGLPASARVLLVVGPLLRHKGCREAVWTLDILHHLHDVRLVVLGGGPNEGRIRRFADAIRLTHLVHWTGPVADVRPWLRRANVVWAPSLREGGRQTVLEAMAAARPVVASRLPGLAEVMIDGKTGFLVTPDDKADLARQTRILLERPDLRRTMGEAGRQHVRESFAPERMVEGFVEAYEA
jgi:glycosyltransferase involved in cell wall biosynthesis